LKHYLAGFCLSALVASLPFSHQAAAADEPTLLATGQAITPTAAPGAVFQTMNPHLKSSPSYVVGQAVSTAVSPDGKSLLVLNGNSIISA
jgi:hypothetical protein